MRKEVFDRLKVGFGYAELSESIIVNPNAANEFKAQLEMFLDAVFKQAGEIMRNNDVTPEEALERAQNLMLVAEEYRVKAMDMCKALGASENVQ